MPRYFFDIRDGDRNTQDSEGTELADLKAALSEAQETLGDLARDKLPDGNHREFVIRVRDDVGAEVFTATLTLRIDWSA